MLLVASLGLSAGSSLAQDDEAVEGGPSTTRVLELAVRQSGGRIGGDALMGLRSLRDPTLRPLFAWLASGDTPAKRRAGVLGLAEINDPPRIDPLMLSKIQDDAEQAAILGEAVSLGLVGAEEVDQILTWPLLEPYIELILRSRLAGEGRSIDVARVAALAETGGMATECLAAVLLAQAGKPERMGDAADRLLGLVDPELGAIVGPLLETIRRDRLSAASPLLRRFELVYGTVPSLNADVLRAWLRVDAKEALPVWTERFASARGPADVLRLTLVLLDAHEFVGASAFDVVEKHSQDAVVLSLGRAGRALASKEGVSAALAEMASQCYAPADMWAVENASKWDAGVAADLYRSIVTAQEGRYSRERPVNLAVPTCIESLGVSDPAFVRALVARGCESADQFLVQAVLTGLMRKGAKPAWDPDHHPKWPDSQSAGMAIVVEARHPDEVSFTGARLEVLRGLAMGTPTTLPPGMRSQAAWLYARIQGESEMVLARLLAGRN